MVTFADALADWLPRQRWFAGKGHAATDVHVAADAEILPGDPSLRHLVVAVSDGVTTDHYQILVGARDRLPDTLSHAAIGRTDDGRHGYDALHDTALTRELLRLLASESTVGPLRFVRVPGAPVITDSDSLVLTGEQSNTSLVYGEQAILKVFRRIAPGSNPDLEVTAALARRGSPHVAAPFGWVESGSGEETTVLAILSRYLRAASDGWSLAAASVRDLYAAGHLGAADAGGDFAPEAHRLGTATAAVHRDLAAAFGVGALCGDAVGELADAMRHRLDTAVAAVPALGRHAGMIRASYARLATLGQPVPTQRIHGDYHLGQAMRTRTGWVLLDFEGEPARPLASRRARSCPLQDVAGMLRSFDYAARRQLLDHRDGPALADLARDWARRNGDAFRAGYGATDDAGAAVLLRAFQLDKAVYEVMYEARHRPSWLPIPLGSLADF